MTKLHGGQGLLFRIMLSGLCAATTASNSTAAALAHALAAQEGPSRWQNVPMIMCGRCGVLSHAWGGGDRALVHQAAT
eukprot:CAMPEP_0115839120 /NCGR_PEP_ID=MMETSP0287-20121206/6088_1 /TAXON_ID=412157 /ORGANISM="Chrysochromulina rotalis, Strain UIO044" /LENGTH=77 /DNA_ID=CAMNT_0003292683 /DNA_START=241 /DNA_END=474 /DNA_ORIENTATION=-